MKSRPSLRELDRAAAECRQVARAEIAALVAERPRLEVADDERLLVLLFRWRERLRLCGGS